MLLANCSTIQFHLPSWPTRCFPPSMFSSERLKWYQIYVLKWDEMDCRVLVSPLLKRFKSIWNSAVSPTALWAQIRLSSLDCKRLLTGCDEHIPSVVLLIVPTEAPSVFNRLKGPIFNMPFLLHHPNLRMVIGCHPQHWSTRAQCRWVCWAREVHQPGIQPHRISSNSLLVQKRVLLI